eukprot:scaffold19749_cov18-Tisochrysis_lutea.AAC.1
MAVLMATLLAGALGVGEQPTITGTNRAHPLPRLPPATHTELSAHQRPAPAFPAPFARTSL